MSPVAVDPVAPAQEKSKTSLLKSIKASFKRSEVHGEEKLNEEENDTRQPVEEVEAEKPPEKKPARTPWTSLLLPKKVTDYQIQIHVEEAKSLTFGAFQPLIADKKTKKKSKDKGEKGVGKHTMMNPVCMITVADQRMHTKVKESTDSPAFGEDFYFHFRESPQELFEKVVEFKIMNSNVIFKDSLIGSFSVSTHLSHTALLAITALL